MCQITLVKKYYSGHMCPWCWVFPRWSASIKAILWVYPSIFTVTSTESQIIFHPCTILVGDHPPVCAGEHDCGGDGGHPDHHLHRRDRPWLRFSNQFGCPETVPSGNETESNYELRCSWYMFIHDISTAPGIRLDGGDFSTFRVLSWPGRPQENSW